MLLTLFPFPHFLLLPLCFPFSHPSLQFGAKLHWSLELQAHFLKAKGSSLEEQESPWEEKLQALHFGRTRVFIEALAPQDHFEALASILE